MWFVFPQLVGLGYSPMARRYGVTGPDEVKAYLAHPTLGSRLHEVRTDLANLPHADAETVFGSVDGTSVATNTVASGESMRIWSISAPSRAGAFATSMFRFTSLVPMCKVTMFGR